LGNALDVIPIYNAISIQITEQATAQTLVTKLSSDLHQIVGFDNPIDIIVVRVVVERLPLEGSPCSGDDADIKSIDDAIVVCVPEQAAALEQPSDQTIGLPNAEATGHITDCASGSRLLRYRGQANQECDNKQEANHEEDHTIHGQSPEALIKIAHPKIIYLLQKSTTGIKNSQIGSVSCVASPAATIESVREKTARVKAHRPRRDQYKNIYYPIGTACS